MLRRKRGLREVEENNLEIKGEMVSGEGEASSSGRADASDGHGATQRALQAPPRPQALSNGAFAHEQTAACLPASPQRPPPLPPSSSSGCKTRPRLRSTSASQILKVEAADNSSTKRRWLRIGLSSGNSWPVSPRQAQRHPNSPCTCSFITSLSPFIRSLALSWLSRSLDSIVKPFTALSNTLAGAKRTQHSHSRAIPSPRS